MDTLPTRYLEKSEYGQFIAFVPYCNQLTVVYKTDTKIARFFRCSEQGIEWIETYNGEEFKVDPSQLPTLDEATAFVKNYNSLDTQQKSKYEYLHQWIATNQTVFNGSIYENTQVSIDMNKIADWDGKVPSPCVILLVYRKYFHWRDL